MKTHTNSSLDRRYRPGDYVEVRSVAGILATLDSNGTLDGLPFMPEMIPYCGCRFRVYRRVNKVFLDGRWYVARLKDTLLLAGVRCEGRSHGNCQLGCHLLWKDAWLSPVDPAEQDPEIGAKRVAGQIVLPTAKGDKFSCQATELAAATHRLPWWDFRQYLWDFRDRQMNFVDWSKMMFMLAYNKIRGAFGLEQYGTVHGQSRQTKNQCHNLQPNDVVQVKSMPEILATLDKQGRNRGLGFAPEMVKYCGGKYRIARRVERLIVEGSGELREIRNTVILDSVTCDGIARRGCPRNCYHLWREDWLTKIVDNQPGN